MEFGATSRCRVCLQHQHNILQLDNVVTVQDELVSLSHILVSCCDVEILHDDKKPQTVCTQCVQDAETAYKFKKTVERADLMLQYELDNMMKVYVKEEEIDIDEAEVMTIEGDHKTGILVPIKNELTDSVSKSYTKDLKFEEKPNIIEEIVCKRCQTNFTNWISLEHHLENCYRRVCGIYEETITSNATLNQHTVTHKAASTDKKFILKQRKKLESHKCTFCKTSYKFPAELKNHLMTHTTVKHYLCSYCGKNFSLSHHSQCERTHSQHSHKHIKKKTGIKASDSFKKQPRFGCSVCKKSYRWQKSLMTHKCINTSKKFHIYSQSPTPYECSHCSKRFNRQDQLTVHERTHTGEHHYECPHCSKHFTRKRDLNRHERIHTGEKPYECSHCSKRFNRQDKLTHHERTHTGENHYECSHCSKHFTRKSDLKDHERIHTGKKPYECSHCSKRFNRPNRLTVHERTHTVENHFECSHCSKHFTRKCDLNKHERTHTGDKPYYECSHCSKRFVHQGYLKNHERFHTGENPYKCSYCSQKFVRQGALNAHVSIHTGEKTLRVIT